MGVHSLRSRESRGSDTTVGTRHDLGVSGPGWVKEGQDGYHGFRASQCKEGRSLFGV